MKVTLYSTGCPVCNVVSAKLRQKNIKYNEINDIDIMLSKGFMSAPMLDVDGNILNSQEAIKFIDNYNRKDN